MAVPVTTRLQPPKAVYLYITALGRMSASAADRVSVLTTLVPAATPIAYLRKRTLCRKLMRSGPGDWQAGLRL